jgi:hypothetical protein
MGIFSIFPTGAKFDGDLVNRESRPYTVDLPSVDKIEVYELDTDMEGKVHGVADSRTIEGDACQKLARLWRSQDYDFHFAAACFAPAYAVLFWKDGKLIVEGQICFDCSQVHFTREVTKGMILNGVAYEGFNGRTAQARKLQAQLEGLFAKNASP